MQPQTIFQSIVFSMAEGVIYLDADDIIRICNPAAEAIRHVHAERILGKSIFAIHKPAAHERIGDLLASLKSGAIASSTRIIGAQNRWFENSYSAIRSPDGDYLGTLLISRDVTEKKRLAEENLQLKQVPGGAEALLVAHSGAMQKVVEMVDAVAPLDSTVLVAGENGTGKERVVELLHRSSERRERPLVRVNCAALPETLIESELFGHVRGAFTGAVSDHKGKFELAHGGTLFLDEIGELPLTAQSKLLRAIQERVVQPVGGRGEIRVDVRIVVASNRDLANEVQAGRFREDLYYRLNVITITLPPLRERTEDILPLATHFLEHFCKEMRRPRKSLAPEVRALLLSCPWPGNVRQLRHAMERAVALGKGPQLTVADLPAELCAGIPALVAVGSDLPLKQALDGYERELIRRTLAQQAGRKGEAARSLGISRKNLWEKMARHGLDAVDVTSS